MNQPELEEAGQEELPEDDCRRKKMSDVEAMEVLGKHYGLSDMARTILRAGDDLGRPTHTSDEEWEDIKRHGG